MAFVRRASRSGGSRLARAARGAGLAALAALAVASAPPARALPIAPLFFEGPGGFGFAAEAAGGVPVAGTVTPESRWMLAGGRSTFTGPGLVVQNQLSRVHQNPQAAGITPNVADPLIADSTWTVRNETGAPLAGAHLVFTAIDIDDRYPGLLAGLDGALLEILHYSSGGTDYVFGAIELPSLGVGQSVDLTVRYVVAGLVDYDAETNSFLLPRLGIAGVVVPEPAAIGAIAIGLAGLATWRRARSPSRSARA